MEKVFKALDGKAAYWDYHPWTDDLGSHVNIDRELMDMKAKFLKWNPKTSMRCAIFEENGNLHNVQRAIVHATVLNVVRRHGDFILTTCAANALQPYLQNDNGWDQGQIFSLRDRFGVCRLSMHSRCLRPITIRCDCGVRQWEN